MNIDGQAITFGIAFVALWYALELDLLRQRWAPELSTFVIRSVAFIAACAMVVLMALGMMLLHWVAP